MINKFKSFSWRRLSVAAGAVLFVGGAYAEVASPVVTVPALEAAEVSSLAALIERCAPTVHPDTMTAIISAESRGHQFAIADAGPVNLPWAQRKHLVRSHYLGSVDEAEAKATSLIANGHTVSLGLAQINDRNLSKLGLSIRDVFEPCANLAAGGKILTEFYLRAVKEFGGGERALRASISAYNSGSWIRGEKEGYVGLVYNQAGKPLKLQTAAIVPKIQPGQQKNNAVTGGQRAASAAGNSSQGRSFAMSARGFSSPE